ncbi:Diacylglycerol kinase [Methylophaga thiooxydans]|uniref:Diacylglycerol kinase n=1 Tax=Methylophaga thiooxydans TaxID=392484 RepID=A0A0A0BH30_9GAMM|nr:diacylglycerol kinase [Methylophaga thiooxydans]KGM07818.1 Diacylglycerol kinase [Methylophaga thiooxydans]
MEKNRGIKRLFYALIYSWQGLKSALKHEEAFRQEFIAFVALTIFSLFLDVTAFERLIMISTLVLVMIVEVLNSAIETTIDRVSFDKHKLSGRAKDYGSFAVLMTILIATASWLTILFL